MTATKKISLFSLTLLIVAAIDSIRTLPTTAIFGTSLIFYYLLAAVIFLIPVAFISAEFSSRFPNEGGVFHWIRHAFGEKFGLLGIWLQWINTMVWYPTMLLFISGTAAYLLHPSLAEDKIFLVLTSLSIFWALTLLNLRGIKASARVGSFCAAAGTIIPMCFLIALGAWWIFSERELALSFSWEKLIPTSHLFENSNALVTIMASFLGMELAGVHVNDIENPLKNFPKAVYYSVLILLGTLMFGSLSVAFVVPQKDIHFIDGIMQTFTTFLNAFNLSFLVPFLAFLIILGTIGGSVNWILSPAKGLMQAAEQGFLPPFFLTKNKNGAPHRILIAQAILVSAFCMILQFVPSVNTYYWFLMALSTGLYMLMYILLFLAAIKLKKPKDSFCIPRGFRYLSCFLGIFSCIITILIGFQPAPDAVISSKLNYVLMIAIGFSLMILPASFLWRYQKRAKLVSEQ